MKFTTLCDFRAAGRSYEAGNTHDSQRLALADEQVERWHARGWVQIEGRSANERRAPIRLEAAQSETGHGGNAQ